MTDCNTIVDKLREYASKTKENPFHEMAVLRKTCHRGIVKCLDCCQDSTYLYLVMEYFDGGDLFDVVKKRGRLTGTPMPCYPTSWTYAYSALCVFMYRCTC